MASRRRSQAAAKSGHFINVSSVGSQVRLGGTVLATKHAVRVISACA
jgi:NADP-dependent 3-hydroxy acid dehydrogenase YdfG